MKHIGNVNVLTAERKVSAKGNEYYRCVGMTDENMPTVFFARVEDEPKEGMKYKQMLDYDARLTAVVKYERA